MREAEKFDVAVVGAGVSGLRAAAGLVAAGRSVVVLEGRDRVGGRLLSVPCGAAGEAAADGVGLDLGATWFWPGERRVARLAADLGLLTHPQYLAGAAIFDTIEAVHRLRDNPLDVPCSRLGPGMQSLAIALAERLPARALRLGAAVRAVTARQDGVVLDGDGAPVRAAQVILALPPALAVSSLRFDPELPADVAALAAGTPVWMGSTAKVLVRYAEPFWRGLGLAGAAVSHRGPLGEIHDASGPAGTPAALFGFAAADPAPAPEQVLAQLVRMFGPAAAAAESVHVQDWRSEPFTAPPGVAGLCDYQRFGHRRYADPLFGGRVHWAGTETSPEVPGHVEGALVAAERAVRAVLGAL